MKARPARSQPGLRWPRANRPPTIQYRQDQLRALAHWEADHHHVLNWPVPEAVLGRFQECLSGHMVLPVGVVGPLAVNLGDDTDTTAAIYGQIAGACYGADDIPREWRERLAMADTIIEMADALCEASGLAG